MALSTEHVHLRKRESIFFGWRLDAAAVRNRNIDEFVRLIKKEVTLTAVLEKETDFKKLLSYHRYKFYDLKCLDYNNVKDKTQLFSK